MRKLLLVYSFLLFSLSLCFSLEYPSNILMQKLPAGTESDYVLSEEGDSLLLYKDKELIKSRTVLLSHSFEDTKYTVKQHDFIHNTDEVFSYSDGLLEKYSFESDADSYVVVNKYSDNRLIFSSIMRPDSADEIIYYLREMQSGKLIGVKYGNVYNWNSSDYLVENGLILTEISDGFFIKNDFMVNDDNSIVFMENDVEYTYSSDGRLLKEVGKDYYLVYEYDDTSTLIKTTETKDSVSKVSSYCNGVFVESSIFSNDCMIEKIIVNDYGYLHILYSDSLPIAEIQYDKDNIKVINVRYLN